MRCSDCKYFKTEGCTFNPEGKDCDSAEAFSCFESLAGNGVQSALDNKRMGNRTKRTGKILFWIGVSGLLLSAALVFAGCSQMTNMDDPEHMGPVILGGLLAIVFFPITVIGSSTFFVGIWGEKKLKGHRGEINMKKAANFSAMAIASLGFDIMGIVWFFLLDIVFYSFFGLLGTVFGVIALINLRKNPALGGRKTAIAGVILGIILVVFSLLAWFQVWRFHW